MKNLYVVAMRAAGGERKLPSERTVSTPLRCQISSMSSPMVALMLSVGSITGR
jgi:hypothetical protein